MNKYDLYNTINNDKRIEFISKSIYNCNCYIKFIFFPIEFIIDI